MRKLREVNYELLVSLHPPHMRAEMIRQLKKGDEIITGMINDSIRKNENKKGRKG